MNISYEERMRVVEEGNKLMHFVVDNYEDKNERVEIIKILLKTFSTDFLISELPDGEVERLRKIINKI